MEWVVLEIHSYENVASVHFFWSDGGDISPPSG